MKILFVSQYFYPENFKGNDIVFSLAERGHDVTVFTGKPNYPSGEFFKGYNFFNRSEEVIKGVRVIRVPLIPRKKGGALMLALNYFSFVFFSYIKLLTGLKNNYDIVFVQQLSPIFSALPGVWIKRKYNIPMLIWVLDLWPESVTAASNIRFKPLIKWIEKIVYKVYGESDHILISSKSFEKSIRQRNKETEITYFPNWAEDVFLKTDIVEDHLIEFPEGTNIVFAGNVGESQDFESVLKAAKLTCDKEINWIIIGDGRKVDWIKKKLSEENIPNVYLLGRFNLEMMPYFFNKADAMLVSLKDKPIFGLTVPAKVQAYMASGCAILGMLNGEGAELIIKAKCGYAVSAGDYIGLAESASKLAKASENEIQIMKRNASEFYVANFERNQLFNQLESILKSMK